MNRLFKAAATWDKLAARFTVNRLLSNEGAQAAMYQDLVEQEKQRETLFARELKEIETEDVLDRALLKAEHAKLSGALPAAEFHRIAAKVDSLKKLRFVEGYEKLQDKEMYEWIKYKTAAEIGGTEELEAFNLYEKNKIDSMGPVNYALFKERTPEKLIL